MNEAWYPVLATVGINLLAMLVQHVKFSERLNNHIKADEKKHVEIDSDSRRQWREISEHGEKLASVQTAIGMRP